MAFFDDMTAALAANPATDVGEHTTFKVRVGNPTHRRALVALATMLAVSLGATSQVGAGALACKPSVTVTNYLVPDIKVLNFKYKIGSNTVYTEGLRNEILSTYGDHEWPSQTLDYAATGVVITESAVEFQIRTSNGWATPQTSVWFPHSFACGANHHYNHEIRP